MNSATRKLHISFRNTMPPVLVPIPDDYTIAFADGWLWIPPHAAFAQDEILSVQIVEETTTVRAA